MQRTSTTDRYINREQFFGVFFLMTYGHIFNGEFWLNAILYNGQWRLAAILTAASQTLNFKILANSNRIWKYSRTWIRGTGGFDSWKKLEVKISCYCPFEVMPILCHKTESPWDTTTITPRPTPPYRHASYAAVSAVFIALSDCHIVFRRHVTSNIVGIVYSHHEQWLPTWQSPGHMSTYPTTITRGVPVDTYVTILVHYL